MTQASNQPGAANRTALVTGAGSGIGRAIAHRLARTGAKVALVGRQPHTLEAVADEIRAEGGTAKAYPADVTDRAQVDRAVAAAAADLGPVKILVNNAGSGRSEAFTKMDAELWDEMLAVNLSSVFHVTQAVLPHMIAAGGGRIVNIASVAGLKGYPYISAYAAAKHGVVGVTRCLAVELASKGITVNAICPGYVDTPMTQATIASIVDKTGRTAREARAELERVSPQKRLFSPDDIASLAAFLCSPEAAGINGQAIPVCGGELAV